jgi:hypothetical protein
VSDHSPDENGIRYEASDADTGGIVRIGLIVAAVVLATVFLLRPALSFLRARQAGFDPPPAPMALEEDQRAPEPRLQEHPFEDVAKLRAADQPLLEGYGWVDEKAGTVRIPIDEAMKIVARRGLPTREQPAPAAVEPATPAAAPEPATPAATPVGGHP